MYSASIADEDAYKPFENLPQYFELKSKVGKYGEPDYFEKVKSRIMGITIYPGVVALTPLGSAFIKVCIDDCDHARNRNPRSDAYPRSITYTYEQYDNVEAEIKRSTRY